MENKTLYRTTIVIWTDYSPNMELTDLAREADCGDAYCSQSETVKVEDPESDPNAPAMDFFFPVEELDS